MPVLPANNPEDVFWHLSNNPTIINGESWYLRQVHRTVELCGYKLRFKAFSPEDIISISIVDEQLVSAHNPITLIKEILRSSIVDSMNQPIGAMDTYASVKPDFLKPAVNNPHIATISMETTAGIATTSSKYLTINTTTNTVNNQGENKMDVKMLAYVAANMDKVTGLIDKWGTETGWETNYIIMLDYTYVKDAVIKKNKVVDADGADVKVYTATVFKAKNGKWYSSLMNNKLHGVEFGDVINFFENEVLVINAKSFPENSGTVFVSKGQVVC